LEELGRKFKEIGFVISPPFQYKLSKEELGAYFESIIGSTELKNYIYLYNNPALFKETELAPEILNKLIDFPNLKGIKDSSKKINKYIAYLNYLSEDFCIYCEKESMFSTFLQLIPTELRKFCGIVPSMSNISNICMKLYSAALKENTLEVIRLQEDLDEYRNKIYDVQLHYGKQPRGLKTAFYLLYKDYISADFNEVVNVSPELERPFENFTYDRIKATVRYLINLNYIDRYFPIGRVLYTIDDFRERFSHLIELGEIKKIKGPYGGKINAIYRLRFENNDVVFRTRTSKAFHYEDIVKEKLIYPFLDKTLNIETPDLNKKVKNIIATKTGSYFFDSQKAPIIPVGNLIFYDETKGFFPYIYTLQQYISGKPLYFILEKYKAENLNLNTPKLLNLFNNLGEILGKMHEIKFDSFHETLINIGKPSKKSWFDIFKSQSDGEFQGAKKNKVDFVNDIREYFKENKSLIEEEDEPILFHNDFHAQNLIIKEETGSFQINGLINFENWQIGVRAQDFVKFDFWTLGPLNEPELKESFFKGYVNIYKDKIDKEFLKKTEIYKVLWLLKVYNFEMDKIKKGEKFEFVDIRFPSAKTYLNEIKRIIMK